MKARFYGTCPIKPQTKIRLTKWFSSDSRVIFLEFNDEGNILWVGPEFPPDLAHGSQDVISESERVLRILTTKVNVIEGWTDFEFDEQNA